MQVVLELECRPASHQQGVKKSKSSVPVTRPDEARLWQSSID